MQHPSRSSISVKALAVSILLFISDLGLSSDVAPDWLSADLGGTTTMAVTNENSYARALRNLPTEDLRRFTFGNRIFNTNWAMAPASVDLFDGLGPVFNRVSCSACHTRDGRGRPPEQAGQSLESMLVRLSVPGHDEHGAVLPVPHYGEQLNEKAIPGVPAEGRTQLSYTERHGAYPDGTPYALQVPHYEFVDLAFGALPADVQFSPRVAPPVFGLGLLEAVPETEILSLADADDANGDGISGRPNQVWDYVTGMQTLGRFGWKANQPSLRQQNAAAAVGDIGITNSLFPKQNVAEGQIAAAHAASGAPAGEVEMKDEFFERLNFYVQTLAVPAARNLDSVEVRMGANTFVQSGCSSCHAPTLHTGTHPEVPQLSGQTIHPFSDLLLHDMGPDLADGRADFLATGGEWRTPPLWGIGLTAVVNRHTHFLHDGRARSLEEAVLWHGGEATAARERFMHLDKQQRAALLTFLNNL